jgi:hypothetical protein
MCSEPSCLWTESVTEMYRQHEAYITHEIAGHTGLVLVFKIVIILKYVIEHASNRKACSRLNSDKVASDINIKQPYTICYLSKYRFYGLPLLLFYFYAVLLHILSFLSNSLLPHWSKNLNFYLYFS